MPYMYVFYSFFLLLFSFLKSVFKVSPSFGDDHENTFGTYYFLFWWHDFTRNNRYAKQYYYFKICIVLSIYNSFFLDHLWTRIFLGYTIIITNNIIYGMLIFLLSLLWIVLKYFSEGLLRVHEMLYNPLGDGIFAFSSFLFYLLSLFLTIIN